VVDNLISCIKNQYGRLMKERILRHMAVLVSGTAIAQLIGVLAAPVLSRLYVPADFGVLGSLLAVTGVITVIGSLKYEMAIVLEKDDRRADALQTFCLLILFAVTVFSAFGFYLAPLWIKGLSDNSELVKLLPLGSLIILFTGLYNIFRFRLNRERKYKAIALAAVIQRLVTVSTQIVLGFVGSASLGLVAGNVVGTILCVGVLAPFVWRETRTVMVSGGNLKSVARGHYRFAAYSAPQNLMNSLSQNMPVYLLGYFFDIKVVGSYFFAMRLLQLPSTLIGQSVRQVFYKEASALINEPSQLFRLFCKTIAGLSAIAIPMILVVFIAGPYLFTAVFGAEWTQAGEFSRWMILGIGIGFINPPATSVLNILDMQKNLAIYDLMLLFFRASILVIGGSLWGVIDTVAAYSFVGVVFNSFMILMATNKLRCRTKIILKD